MKNSIEILETTSTKSNTEISNMLNGNHIFVDNFKYVDYEVVPVVLKSTIYDLKNLLNEKAKVREGFYIDSEGRIIKIPNFFIKLNGVLSNKKEWNNLLDIINNNAAIFYDFNIAKDFLKTLDVKQKEELCKLIKKKSINSESLIEFNSSDKTHIKNTINTYIFDYIITKLEDFLSLYNISKDVKFDEDVIVNFVLNILFMPKSIVEKLNNWDFSSYIPKIVIYDETAHRNASIEDYLMVDFLNYLGMDVVIVTPTGKSNIDKFDFELNSDFISNIVLDKFVEPLKHTKEEKKEIHTTIKFVLGIAVGFIISIFVLSTLTKLHNEKIREKNEIAAHNLVISINNLGTITLEDEDSIKELISQYNNLNSYGKNLVNNYSQLENANSQIKSLNQSIPSNEKTLTNIMEDLMDGYFDTFLPIFFVIFCIVFSLNLIIKIIFPFNH